MIINHWFLLRAKTENKNINELAEAAGVVYLLEQKDEEEKENVEESRRETRAQKAAEEKPERISARQKQAREKEDADKEIPVENIDWEKVTPAEREAWKSKQKKKEAEMMEVLQELQHGYAIYPLGRDRTYRRYWVFRSLPGLYVEDQEEFVPDDLFKAVPQTDKPRSFDAENLSSAQGDGTEVKSTSSDKENDQKVLNGTNEKGAKPLNDLIKNGVVEPMDVDVQSSIPTETVFDQIEKRNTYMWSYIGTQEQFDKLTDSLNPRGIREGPLKAALLEQKDQILASMKSCPTDILSSDGGANNKQGVKYQSLKSRNRVTQGAVKNSSAKEFIELNLREMLLDLEERIYAGALGAIKVSQIFFMTMLCFDIFSNTQSWDQKRPEN